MKIVFSGTGPGLLFMAFGVIVLSTGIVYGGAKVKDDTRILKNMVDQTNDRVMELRKITDKRFMEIANETSIRIDRNREYGLQSLQESYKEPLYRLEDQMTKLKVKIEELEKNRERQ